MKRPSNYMLMAMLAGLSGGIHIPPGKNQYKPHPPVDWDVLTRTQAAADQEAIAKAQAKRERKLQRNKR